MVAVVHELADRGRTLGLLSNIIEELVPIWEERHGDWLGRFTALTYSCRIGVAKPDRRAYEICAERLGVTHGGRAVLRRQRGQRGRGARGGDVGGALRLAGAGAYAHRLRLWRFDAWRIATYAF